MEKVHFNQFIQGMDANSVKRACYIVREYLRCSKKVKKEGHESLEIGENCAVTLEEYLDASRILLAYAYQNSDKKTVVDLSYCESDCEDNYGCDGFCRGEFQITNSSKTKILCKYYTDSQNI